jgi:glycosyltransferase involved in cell wall biosynthesis
MRLLVDGVVYQQLAASAIGRLWTSLLPRLIAAGGCDVFLLDRGGLPEVLGATVIPFPSYTDRYTADDSFLLQKMCDFLTVDVFTSTYHTSPLSTPMLLVVHDMIPERFSFDLGERSWREKEIAISFARRFVAVSGNTKKDLVTFYPEIPEEVVTVAYQGVDKATFKPLDEDRVAAFRKQIGSERPYFLLVGSREVHKSVTNNKLFFDALSALDTHELDVLWINPEEGSSSFLRGLPNGVRGASYQGMDGDLALAYNGALALIHPSMYDGLGQPVLEAMASGCPVVTTRRGEFKEAAAECCIAVDPDSLPQMVAALEAVLEPSRRRELTRAGFLKAEEFEWDTLVGAVHDGLIELAADHKAGRFASFFEKWGRLRSLQSSVDEETLE